MINLRVFDILHKYLVNLIYKHFVYKSVYSGKKALKHNYIQQLAFRLLDFQWKGIKLHINNECNLQCKHCYSNQKGGILTKKQIFMLLDQLKKGLINRNLRLDILGGEPLLRKDFLDIISYAKNKINIKNIQVYTNGTLINRDFAFKMKKSGVDTVIITLHSNRKKIHDSITQCNGSWSKAVAGIKYSLKAGIKTYCIIIPGPHNEYNLKNIELFVKELGAKTIYFPYIKQQQHDPMAIEDRKKFQDSINWMFTKSSKHKKDLLSYLKRKGKICAAFVGTITIRSNGTVTPCAFVDLALGNIKKERLYTILHKTCFNQDLIDFLSVPEECKKCSIVKFCGGGCKASSYKLYHGTKCKDINCSGPYNVKVSPDDLGNYLPYSK